MITPFDIELTHRKNEKKNPQLYLSLMKYCFTYSSFRVWEGDTTSYKDAGESVWCVLCVSCCNGKNTTEEEEWNKARYVVEKERPGK